MSFKVSIDKFSLKYELGNLLLTALLAILPLVLISFIATLVPLFIVVLGVSSFALAIFSIWILEVVGAVSVPISADSAENTPESSTVTIIISAYLPNEKDIILDTVSNALSFIDRLPGTNYVILTYRSPFELPVEQRLREIAEREPRFRLMKIDKGIGRPYQMNQAARASKTEFVYFIDADSHPVLDQAICLGRYIEGKNIVQGQNAIRNTEHLLGKIVAIEFSTEYLVSYHARAYWTKVAYFCGSNGIWRRDVACEVPFSPKTLIEDVDVSVRAYLQGYTITVQPRIEARELAPPTLKDWWDQRRRWAQGYLQVGREYTASLLRDSRLSIWRKLNWLYAIYGREIIYSYTLLVLIAAYFYTLPHGGMSTSLRSEWMYVALLVFWFTGFAQVLGVVIQSHRYEKKLTPFAWLLIFVLIYPVYQLLKAIVTISGLAEYLLGRSVYRVTPRNP